MQVTVIPQYRIKPGHLATALEMFADGKRIMLKHGASNVRVRRFVVGGAIVGVHQALIEFESMAAWGEAAAAFNADPDYQDLNARINTSDSALQPVGMLITNHVAQFGNATTGQVALLRRWKLQPGRLDEFLALIEEVVDVSSDAGLSVVVQHITIGGDNSGQLVTAGFSESMTALGAYMDRLDSDPELLRLQAQAFGSNAPVELLGMAISTEVSV